MEIDLDPSFTNSKRSAFSTMCIHIKEWARSPKLGSSSAIEAQNEVQDRSRVWRLCSAAQHILGQKNKPTNIFI